MKYAVSLIEILRTVAEAGERADEQVEAIWQIERALLNCVEFSTEDRGDRATSGESAPDSNLTLECDRDHPG